MYYKRDVNTQIPRVILTDEPINTATPAPTPIFAVLFLKTDADIFTLLPCCATAPPSPASLKDQSIRSMTQMDPFEMKAPPPVVPAEQCVTVLAVRLPFAPSTRASAPPLTSARKCSKCEPRISSSLSLTKSAPPSPSLPPRTHVHAHRHVNSIDHAYLTHSHTIAAPCLLLHVDFMASSVAASMPSEKVIF